MKMPVALSVVSHLVCVLGAHGAEPPSRVTSQPHPVAKLDLAKQSFVNPYVKDGFACGNKEVMVGIHMKEHKVICASLNFGYRVLETIRDPKKGTQVSSNPSMHGCPANYFIQKLISVNELNDRNEELVCVSLENKNDTALAAPTCEHDGRGPDDRGTQSSIYGLTPTMHSCRDDFAMRGIHQRDNDLYCCR